MFKVDREGKGNEEANERNAHGDVVAFVVGHEASQGGEESAAGDGRHDPGGAALGVAAQAADREGEDGREDAGFEEEDQREHGHSSFAVSAHGGGNEDHHPVQEDHEDPPGFDKHHRTGYREAAECEEALANGIAVWTLGGGDAGALDRVLDELGCDPDLCADIAELSGHAEEEFVLIAHGLVDVARETGGLLGLKGHVGIRNLWDRREEEDDGQEKDEGGDAEVGPLHVGEVVGVRGFEEHTRGQEWGHDRADGLEGLGELETELG